MRRNFIVLIAIEYKWQDGFLSHLCRCLSLLSFLLHSVDRLEIHIAVRFSCNTQPNTRQDNTYAAAADDGMHYYCIRFTSS